MYDLTNISIVKQLMAEAGINFRKSLGQNFLVNKKVCPFIAENCGASGIGVLEIGTGVGVLTSELCKVAQKVVCIEIDEGLKPILQKTLSEYNNVKVIFIDVLKADIADIISEELSGMEVVVCGNLPYYITSPVIMKLLEEELPIKSITVMVQKEVALRLCAKVGDKQAGAITASINYYGECKLIMNVGKNSFYPAPKIDSAVIKIDINDNNRSKVNNKDLFFKIVKTGFNNRRKQFQKALKSLGYTLEQIDECFSALNIPIDVRIEKLDMDSLINICNFLEHNESV